MPLRWHAQALDRKSIGVLSALCLGNGQETLCIPAVVIASSRRNSMNRSPRPIAGRARAPQQRDEFERLSLYHGTSGGEAALARKRREDAIRVTGRALNSRPFLTAHTTPREMCIDGVEGDKRIANQACAHRGASTLAKKPENLGQIGQPRVSAACTPYMGSW